MYIIFNTMAEIYIHKEGSDALEPKTYTEFCNEFKIGGCLFGSISSAFEHLKKINVRNIHDYYFVLPGYYAQSTEYIGKKSQQKSFQLAITGKVKYNQTVSEGFLDELYEEIGISNFDYIKRIGVKEMETATIDYACVVFNNDIEKPKEKTKSKSKDNYLKHLCLFTMVHKDILELLICRKRHKSNDIAGEIIVIVKPHILVNWYRFMLDKKESYNLTKIQV